MSCTGRVVAITGAGRGVGKEHALLFAREGAKVVVNDLDKAETDGVVAEIKAMGGEAAANYDDCSTWEGGKGLIKQCIEAFGGIDTLVNNAGILRDKTLINMSESEWDAIMQVHLKGTFVPSKAACEYWRECEKAGKPRKGRIINTSSTSGLYGNYGQANYGAAKAGIAAVSVILNAEMDRFGVKTGRFGVKVNCIAPAARTRMTENLGIFAKPKEGMYDPFSAANISPTVVYLGSDDCSVGGAVLLVQGPNITNMENWQPGKQASKSDSAWNVSELKTIIPGLVADSKMHPMYAQMAAAAAAKKAHAKM